MLPRTPVLRSTTHQLFKIRTSTTCSNITPSISTPSRRHLHGRIIAPPPPRPTPFVPDASTFLTLIGRKLSQHASKIPSWAALFNLTSTQLKDLGIDPPRNRRYLLRWRERFRRGEWGVGGDLKHVKEGVARIWAVDVPLPVRDGAVEGAGTRRISATMTKTAGERRVILNLPHDEEGTTTDIPAEALARRMLEGGLKPVVGVHIKGATQIYGPHVEPVKGTNGSVAVIRVKEGLWEHKRGVKVDGGERRKAEVRFKRRKAERKAARG